MCEVKNQFECGTFLQRWKEMDVVGDKNVINTFLQCWKERIW